MSSTKRVSKRLNFTDLPPRVIIIDILSFFKKEIYVKNFLKFYLHESPYELFGYFQRDNFRNIWFVFTSIRIVFSLNVIARITGVNYFDTLYICYPKLSSLVVHLKSDTLIGSDSDKLIGSDSLLMKFWKALIEKSPNMYSLKSLKLRGNVSFLKGSEDEGSDELDDIFSNKNCFPNLRRFEDGGIWYRTKEWEKNEDVKPFQTISSIKVEGFHSKFRYLKFQIPENMGKNLISLFLSSVKFDSNVVFSLPLLKTLVLQSCEKVEVISSSNLIHLNFISMEGKCLKRTLENATNLRTMCVGSVRNLYSQWFLNKSGFVNPLSKLSDLTLRRISDIDSLEQNLISFIPQLETFKVFTDHSSTFDNIITHPSIQRLPRLKKLEFEHIKIRKNFLHSDCLSELRELVLRWGEFNEDIFITNKFPNLEYLHLRSWRGRVDRVKSNIGKNFNQMPSLRKLRICSFRFPVREVDEAFFREQKFEKLEYLELYNVYSVTGSKWKNSSDEQKFCRMRKIKIDRCPSFCDDLFREIEFPSLVKIKVTNCPLVKFQGWKRNNLSKCKGSKVFLRSRNSV